MAPYVYVHAMYTPGILIKGDFCKGGRFTPVFIHKSLIRAQSLVGIVGRMNRKSVAYTGADFIITALIYKEAGRYDKSYRNVSRCYRY